MKGNVCTTASLSPSEISCVLGFRNQFKNKNDEGGCNLLPFMQIRYGPRAPASCYCGLALGLISVNPDLLFH